MANEIPHPPDDETGTAGSGSGLRTSDGAPASGKSRSVTYLRRRFGRRRRGLAGDKAAGGIPALQPEDTGTRRALEQSERGGRPVSFAVQLMWSAEPIDGFGMAREAIPRGCTVYTTRTRRNAREWFELRLGFFSDQVSARRVAFRLRAKFASPAIVPVSPEEQAAARELARAARKPPLE